ncbi:MAG TPA: cytochrome c oxidase subunit 3 [Polyangia bacterium]|nr:cytochrome c oxidase subunit 3 [Polyangia bacterium]
MNARKISTPAPEDGELSGPLIRDLPPDKSRGSFAMALTITTEAMLFVSLFFAYFYVGRLQHLWPAHPPKLKMALILLAILVGSSGTIYAGEHALKKGARVVARLALIVTILLGVLFMAIQVLEYLDHLQELTPRTNAYGSLFYVITGFHALHVVAGLLMLIYVACLPDLDPPDAPHRPLHNAALYWHFVDVVWVFVVATLYVLPHWTRLP